jgi:hypothetical protein
MTVTLIRTGGLSAGRLAAAALPLLLLVGCAGNPREEFGKTYYLDGAGNWGWGVAEVPKGLRDAGYQGDVEVFIWTSSLNPAIDQVNVLGNRLRAAMLTGKIQDYLRRHPDQDVNIIALSAGTGIATWAVEALNEGEQIANLVLLGSSLSYDYDMSRALRRIRGNVYVYYSAHDEILLTGARALGTVDRKFVDGAGLRGLHPSGGRSPKIVNIGWTSRYTRLGWTGAHTDATNPSFVQHEIARRLFPRGKRPASGRTSGGTAAVNLDCLAMPSLYR